MPKVLGHLNRVLATKVGISKASHLFAIFADSFTRRLDRLLYNLTYYRAASSQEDLAKDSIRQYLFLHLEEKAKAVSDDDLIHVRIFIPELKL